MLEVTLRCTSIPDNQERVRNTAIRFIRQNAGQAPLLLCLKMLHGINRDHRERRQRNGVKAGERFFTYIMQYLCIFRSHPV